jgi:hypothetical protein
MAKAKSLEGSVAGSICLLRVCYSLCQPSFRCLRESVLDLWLSVCVQAVSEGRLEPPVFGIAFIERDLDLHFHEHARVTVAFHSSSCQRLPVADNIENGQK